MKCWALSWHTTHFDGENSWKDNTRTMSLDWNEVSTLKLHQQLQFYSKKRNSETGWRISRKNFHLDFHNNRCLTLHCDWSHLNFNLCSTNFTSILIINQCEQTFIRCAVLYAERKWRPRIMSNHCAQWKNQQHKLINTVCKSAKSASKLELELELKLECEFVLDLIVNSFKFHFILHGRIQFIKRRSISIRFDWNFQWKIPFVICITLWNSLLHIFERHFVVRVFPTINFVNL